MTIATTINRVSYAGNGSTTVFSFPYYFLQNADLVVVKRNNTTGVETTQTITTNYTITGAGLPAGGSVTMLSAPASGETLIIYRDPAKVQDLDLVENMQHITPKGSYAKNSLPSVLLATFCLFPLFSHLRAADAVDAGPVPSPEE